MSQVEAKYPNFFQYHLVPDDGVTGRFEVTYYKTLESLTESKPGLQLHSKKKSMLFPGDQFLNDLSLAIGY